MIDKFIGDFKGLSNFAAVIIFWKGLKMPTVEHAYAASKSLNPRFWLQISLITADKAGVARKMGRNTKLRPGWKDIQVDIMEKFLRQKFDYDKFKKLLLSTGDQELIEGNFWHDNFWGDCSCERCFDKEGLNNLGKLHMKIRGEMK